MGLTDPIIMTEGESEWQPGAPPAPGRRSSAVPTAARIILSPTSAVPSVTASRHPRAASRTTRPPKAGAPAASAWSPTPGEAATAEEAGGLCASWARWCPWGLSWRLSGLSSRWSAPSSTGAAAELRPALQPARHLQFRGSHRLPDSSASPAPTGGVEPTRSPEPSGTIPASQTATSFTLNRKDFTLSQAGDVWNLGPAFLPAGSTGTLTWNSSKPEVATVSDSGIVTAVAPGVATITATMAGGYTQECIVRCTWTGASSGGSGSAAATLTPSHSDVTLYKAGESFRFRVSGHRQHAGVEYLQFRGGLGGRQRHRHRREQGHLATSPPPWTGRPLPASSGVISDASVSGRAFGPVLFCCRCNLARKRL